MEPDQYLALTHDRRTMYHSPTWPSPGNISVIQQLIKCVTGQITLAQRALLLNQYKLRQIKNCEDFPPFSQTTVVSLIYSILY